MYSPYPTPLVVREEEAEVKTRYAHAPMGDGKGICLGRISWRSFPRGIACACDRCVMPTENLHWLIRAQLAKRGCHSARVRIAPGDLPGYAAFIRDTNSTNGGDAASPSKADWAQKTNGRDDLMMTVSLSMENMQRPTPLSATRRVICRV